MKTENTVTIRGKISCKVICAKIAFFATEPASQTVNHPTVYCFGKAAQALGKAVKLN